MKRIPSNRHKLASANRRLAKKLWGDEIAPHHLLALNSFTQRFGLAIANSEVLLLQGKWYVTHAGLLRLAHRNRCCGIRVQPLREFCDAAASRWVFKATVYKSPHSKGFVGYGDAEPSNVSSLVRGAEMRVAETRAVNRALRKAYGIGLCSVEELGSLAAPVETAPTAKKVPTAVKSVPSNGQPRLRDRLCQLIRQHQLDPTLVKRYAADFCGTETLREASRDLVEGFVNHLAELAAKDPAGLLCQLNSYAQPQEAKS
jgi:hypothetical protein